LPRQDAKAIAGETDGKTERMEARTMAIIRREPLLDIERWEPFREMEHLHREMNRLFERFMKSGNGRGKGIDFIPSVEMEETADTLYLTLEIPGMEAKDLDLEVTEDSISIKGERKSETRTEEGGVVRSEFHYGKFERTIPLSVAIANDKVKAEYKNGLLKLSLPKLEPDKHKAIKVEIA
jgi:HSP20 family protein